jgi:hypothetical protein
MIATLATSPFQRAMSESPEALDAELLDYLAACEGAEDNWTVVAADQPPRRPDTVDKKPDAPPPDSSATPEERRP